MLLLRGFPKKVVLLALVASLLIMVFLYGRRSGTGGDARARIDYTYLVNQLARWQGRAAGSPGAALASSSSDEGVLLARQPPGGVVSFRHSTTPGGGLVAGRSGPAAAGPMCPAPLKRKSADMETSDLMETLDYDASWIPRREFWNNKMQKRYERRRKEMWPKVPLKVFVMPHSHNDPGWLKTFDGYFNSATKTILNNAVDKLTKNKNMTFVWPEISYLSLWYDGAHDARKANLQQLVAEGRFEVVTGGWIMTDEANVHVFAMVDQIIEGHQWVKNYLNVIPRHSWSIDPFGHGGTYPYVLKSAGLDSMVIMRIHYAWKEWFAREQQGDFLWQQPWASSAKSGDGDDSSILCHNFPYDIYSIKGSCGPHPEICLGFNFRHVSGMYGEYASRYTPITPSNLKERAELLLEQYGKTGSLFPHNVVLAPLGDDFTYNHPEEWDQQYTAYKQLMEFINSQPEKYHAEIRFGTLKDYFREVRKRTSKFDTLNGDFFVYSDIFSEGRPAYWSGYFTTRPYMKKLSREAEAKLRSAEVLFTLAYNRARQSALDSAINALAELYSSLVEARRQVGLFQHHDAITGTAKQFVMHDYGLKLFAAIKACGKIERLAMQYLMTKNPDRSSMSQELLREDFLRRDYFRLPTPVALDVKRDQAFVAVFNPLAQAKYEVVAVFVQNTDICVYDSQGNKLDYQINPTWNVSGNFRLDVSFVEVTFVARLPALSLSKFKVETCKVDKAKREKTVVYCQGCPKNNNSEIPFDIDKMPEGSIQLENSQMLLRFDEKTKLLSSVTHKKTGKQEDVSIQFTSYTTTQFRSGAYLFKPDLRRGLREVFGVHHLKEVIVISGPVFSEVTAVYETQGSHQQAEPGSFVHTVRLYHTADELQSKGVYIENDFNFGDSANHNNVDLIMRLNSKLKNDGVSYTDQNGFQMQKRHKIEKIGIEGNYFPITTMTYIEDDNWRLSLAVDHAMGAAAWEEGQLEVMVDRRSSYDDARGMGEGVLDSRETTHKYWLLLEPKEESSGKSSSDLLNIPSQVANTLSLYLNNPSVQYVGHGQQGADKLEGRVPLLSAPLPCDLHLFNLRTLPDPNFPTTPSREALLILHRVTGDCGLNAVKQCGSSDALEPGLEFVPAQVKGLSRTSLTGLEEKSGGQSLTKLSNIKVKPMALETVRLRF